MIPLPQDDSFSWKQLPWVSLAFFLIYLGLFAGWQSSEAERYQQLYNWYQSSGLYELERPNYISWLRIDGQATKADRIEKAHEQGDALSVFKAMAFDPAFARENQARGDEYWSQRQYLSWQENRERFIDKASMLPRYGFGLISADHPLAGPADYLTWHFLHDSIWQWLLALLVLLPFALALEHRLGWKKVPLLWILGGVLAGLGYTLLAPENYIPLVGSTAAVSAIIGAYAAHLGRGPITFLVFSPKQKGWQKKSLPALILLPLWLLLPAFELLFSRSNADFAWLAILSGLFGGALLVHLIRDTEVGDDEPSEEDHAEQTRLQTLGQGWDAMERFEFPDADRHFRAVLKDNPDDFEALNGRVLVNRGRDEQALAETLTQWLEATPEHETQTRQQMLLLREMERQNELAELPADVRLRAAMKLARTGALREAANLVDAALEEKPDTPWLLKAVSSLAQALERTGDEGKASRYQRAAESLVS
jgi:membrane associated rhomboid family serine protease